MVVPRNHDVSWVSPKDDGFYRVELLQVVAVVEAALNMWEAVLWKF